MDTPVRRTGNSQLGQARPWLCVPFMMFSATLFPLPALANSQQVPWECSNYSGEAQTRCLNGFIEQQREQINKLEGQLQAQQETVGQLKGQVDQQAAATAALQRQLSQRRQISAQVFLQQRQLSLSHTPIAMSTPRSDWGSISAGHGSTAHTIMGMVVIFGARAIMATAATANT